MLPSSEPFAEPAIGREVTPATSLAARAVLEQAVRLDARSALAWSQLATCYISDYKNRWNEAGEEEVGAGLDLVRCAQEALARADEIEPNLARSRYAEGFIRCVEGRHQDGYEAMDRATRLDPNFAAAYAQKANQLVRLGRAEEALQIAQYAIELGGSRDQSVGVFYWVLGRAYSCCKTTATQFAGCSNRSISEVISGSMAHSSSPPIRLLGAAKRLMRRCDRGFGWYTPRRIAEIYGTELPNNEQLRHQECSGG